MNMPRSLSHDTKKCDSHVYTSFFQPLTRRKVVREVTQHVSETTSEDSEQDVAETTVNPLTDNSIIILATLYAPISRWNVAGITK